MSGKFKVHSGRFATSTEEEIKIIMQECNSKNTIKSTKSAVTLLRECLSEKSLPILEEVLDCDLPDLLRTFYVDARKKNNELYHTQSMKNIRSGLNRYFQETRKINIINDPEYSTANMIFKGVQVRAKKAGRGVRRSTPCISNADMKQLAIYFNIDHIKTPNPRVLQSNVLFNIYYLCRRGQENLVEMQKDWFEVKVEHDGMKYIIQVRDEMDKNHREEDHTMTNQGKMYSVPDCINCPVATYELYLSKLHPDCPYLWQKPREVRVNYIDSTWYQARQVGHNPLEGFMKQLCDSASLSCQEYTNHSIRSTCISRLDEKGFEAHHITAISSHKSESTIKEYSVHCPERKRKEMFDALAEPLANIKTPKSNPTPSVSKASETAIVPANQSADTNLTINIPTIPNDIKSQDLDLLEMDNSDDQLLSEILTQTENYLKNAEPVNTLATVTTKVENCTVNKPIPVVPRMYFPNSNVTINYNFNK